MGRVPNLEEISFRYPLPPNGPLLGTPGRCVRGNGAALAELGRALGCGKVKGLQKISIECAEEGSEGVAGLAGLGSGNMPSLHHLSLKIGRREGEGGRALGEVLGRGREALPSLKILELKVGVCRGLESLCAGLLEGTGSLPASTRVDLCLCGDGGGQEGEEEIESEEEGEEGDHVGVLSDNEEGAEESVAEADDSSVSIGGGEEGIEEEGEGDGDRDGEDAADRSILALSAVLRAGKIPGLRKVEFDESFGLVLGREAGKAFGEAFSDAVVCLSALEEIKLVGDIFRDGEEEGMEALLEGMCGGLQGLPSLKTLRCLQTTGNVAVYLGEKGAQALGAGLSTGRFPSLSSLWLTCNYVENKGMQALCGGISSPKAPRLRSLCLELGDCFDPAVPAQVEILSGVFAGGSLSRLDFLSLEGNFAPAEATTLCRLGSGKARLSQLTTLDLSQMVLHTEHVRAFAEISDAQRFPWLQKLVMSASLETLDSTGMTDEGLRALTDAWVDRDPPPLCEWDLEDNALTDEGASCLVSLLSSGKMSGLQEVNLG
eukprot:Cvel_644.t1-p1 / transcript=Cvel_644.t1 / gene=Cvel_644 / organism=Chromera_velia_CCMP2878 / gene_product=hypothetical protein / transcript_product=hypothetical protein / location=Cvel_scaffold19:193683-195314(-) / protein_length=544 / sequence_SO=supercontig / SO=protein_coding / is_pseudo=false